MSVSQETKDLLIRLAERYEDRIGDHRCDERDMAG